MPKLNLSPSDLDLILTALRQLQENLHQLPEELLTLNDGQAPTEEEIDDLCASLTLAASQ